MTSPVAPVSAISDVLALWGHDGWLTPPLAPVVAASEARLGRVLTLQMATAESGPGLAPLFEVLSGALDGRVLVIAGARDAPGAVWGEILTAAALQAGAAAVLVDGAVRDRPDMQRLGLPVYAAQERIVGPNGRAHVVGIEQSVVIDGTAIRPADHVAFDATGCVRIPAEHLDDVLDAAARYAAGEQEVVTAIEGGATLAGAYLHKRSVVEQLRR